MATELDTLYRQLEEKVAAKSMELVRSERLASVGYLAAGVAHEINNPMGIIAGFAELSLQALKQESPPEALAEAEKSMKVIAEEAFRCKQLTQKLLSLARQSDDNPTVISLKDVAGNVINRLTGLGLSISHMIIQNHGGRITATSPVPDKGSTFTLHLPAAS